MEKKLLLLFGIIILILGILILPPVAEIAFGEYVCGHYNMYLTSISICLIGIYIIFRDK